jgi:hypothetical protein
MASDAFLTVFLVAAGVLVVFLILREFWTWYWKQSQQLAQLKRIGDALERLEARSPGYTGPRSAAAGSPAPPKGWRDSLLDRMAGVP